MTSHCGNTKRNLVPLVHSKRIITSTMALEVMTMIKWVTHSKLDTGKGGVEGMTLKDTVYLTDNIEIKEQIFGAVTETETERKGYDGLIGYHIPCVQVNIYHPTYQDSP